LWERLLKKTSKCYNIKEGGTMNKKITLPKISELEEDRAHEIEFTMNIKRIFHVFGQNIKTYEVLESLCQYSGVSITLIKTLASAVLTPGNLLVPDKKEEIIMLYRMDYTLDFICLYAETSNRSIYRILEEHVKNMRHPDTIYEPYLPRMKEEYLPHIRKFNETMRKVRKL